MDNNFLIPTKTSATQSSRVGAITQKNTWSKNKDQNKNWKRNFDENDCDYFDNYKDNTIYIDATEETTELLRKNKLDYVIQNAIVDGNGNDIYQLSFDEYKNIKRQI